MKEILILILTIFIVMMIISIMKVKKGKKIKRTFVFSIVLFLILIVIFLFVYIKLSIPKLNINGNEIVNIEVFSKYNDEGFTLDNEKYSKKVITTNNVNTDKVGIYEVTYSFEYYGRTISKIRKVVVEDKEKPNIKLEGGESITVIQGNEYKEPGYTASDNYDGDLTNKVKVEGNVKDEVGTYVITYYVEDSNGNSFSVKRNVNVKINDNTGVVYLTFDDGPSSSTNKILDILKEKGVKATFFVVNFSDYYSDAVKRIVEEGHTIALHSYTHQYKLIYASEKAYFDDLYKLRNRVKDVTGVESNITRFPGGSSNTVSSFNKGIMSRLTKAVREKGFHYFDWNVDSSDAWSARNSTDVYNNVINGLHMNRNNVVLMHDLGSNVKTVEALPKIIDTMKKKGYSFSKITYDTPMVTHGVRN